jgi:hypothetical protein
MSRVSCVAGPAAGRVPTGGKHGGSAGRFGPTCREHAGRPGFPNLPYPRNRASPSGALDTPRPAIGGRGEWARFPGDP